MSTNTPTSADPFGLQMLKPTKTGGQVWFMYNTDFNDDPQIYTESASLEYVLHNVVDADGTQFTIANDAAFKAYISTTTGLIPSQTITDQQEMTRRGYMQNAQDWRNVEITGQMVIFTESTTDFITLGIRGGRDGGTGAPQGCTGSRYLVEFAMTHGGLVRVRKKSWNNSVHNWLSGLASGFDATKVCGWSFKILCYNTQDVNGVNVEVWLAPLNDNHFVKVLSGVDTGQLNTDANICNCTNVGQPLTWGGPAILLQGNSGKFGFKNMSIREIEGFGATLPPIDPNPTPDPGTGGTGGGGTGTGGGSGGGGGSGSGSGTGSGGGGGVPVDLTPVLATPQTAYVEYGGGPNYSPLQIHTIFAGSAWNSTTSGSAPSTATSITTPATTTTTQTASPILANPLANIISDSIDTIVFKSSTTVHFIFWGSAWNNTSKTPFTKDTLMSAIDKVFKSSYFDGLIQYHGCTRPTIGSISVNTTYAPVNNFVEADLGNVIIDSINHNLVPDNGIFDVDIAPDTIRAPNTIYYVIGTTGNNPSATFSATFLTSDAFHNVYKYTADNTNYVYGYSSDHTTLVLQTLAMFNQIVNAITDPFPFRGCVSTGTPNTLGNPPEITEFSTTQVTINGTSVYKYWSDQDGAAIAPLATPTWISCSSGFIYNPITQQCERSVSTTTTAATAAATTADPGTNIQTATPILATPTTSYTILAPPDTVDPLQFYFIFWGPTWATSTGASQKTNIMNNMTTIFNSAYFDGLFQYGFTKRPILKGSVINTTSTINNPFAKEEITDLCIDAQNRNQVPKNRLGSEFIAYVVVLPDGFRETGLPSVSGGHTAVVYTDGHRDFWAWTALPAATNSQTIEEIITHEMAEIVVSNSPGKGYVIKQGTPLQTTIDTYGIEIADACEDTLTNRRGTLSGLTVSKYWSDQSGSCTFTTSKPAFISCPTGYTWNNTTQQCEKTVTTPSSIAANAALKTQTQNAITSLINSTYFTGLYQYGLTKKPTVGTFAVNTTNAAIPNKYTQTQITALVNDSISKNLVPAASATNKNVAYLVILPPRITYTTGSIGGHYANEFNPTTPTTQYYQIIATASLNVTFDDFTKTISEALIAVVSQNNPIGGGKGYNIKSGTVLDSKIATNGDELYGPCRDDTTNNKISGITVAKYWSDQDGACIIPASSTSPTPWATCHTGATFDQPTQTCKLLPGGTGGGTTPTGGGGQGYTVALANASGDDGNVPANAVDGKLDTRWSAFGKGQFLRLDLGTAKKVNKIKIAWYQGDKRANHFEITTAETQGGAFTSQLKTDSQQGSTALQDYAINPPNPVRYIRIIVNGNTVNDWASISEVEVWGPDVPSGTPSTGTGGDPGSGGTVPGGDTGGGTQTPPPATQASYNFFDTSFSVDYQKIGLCNPVE